MITTLSRISAPEIVTEIIRGLPQYLQWISGYYLQFGWLNYSVFPCLSLLSFHDQLTPRNRISFENVNDAHLLKMLLAFFGIQCLQQPATGPILNKINSTYFNIHLNIILLSILRYLMLSHTVWSSSSSSRFQGNRPLLACSGLILPGVSSVVCPDFLWLLVHILSINLVI
jgi:hypothetical protein